MTKADSLVKPVGIVQVELEVPMKAAPEAIWTALVDDTRKWWLKEYYATPEPKGIFIEARPGGRMYEEGTAGEGLLWGMVIALEPHRSINLVSYLAPPYAQPAVSLVRFSIESAGKSTSTFHVSDSTFGSVDSNTRMSIENGWKTLFETGLKPFVEAARKR